MKIRIRKNSLLWWMRELWFFVMAAVILMAVGLGDVPAAASASAEGLQQDSNRIITYIPVEESEPDPEPVLLGEFTVTAYCPCSQCCGKWSNPDKPLTASGEPAVEGITVGADWRTIPAGTVIEIEGIGERIVQDKPADWIVEKYNGMIIDLYFDSHQEALELGKQQVMVWEVPQ